jgi:hypothetical protein
LDVPEACRYAIEAAKSVGQASQIELRLQHTLAGAGPAMTRSRKGEPAGSADGAAS